MKHADGRIIVFPFHDEIDRFTLRGALRDAEVDLNEFLENVRWLFGVKIYAPPLAFNFAFDLFNGLVVKGAK